MALLSTFLAPLGSGNGDIDCAPGCVCCHQPQRWLAAAVSLLPEAGRSPTALKKAPPATGQPEQQVCAPCFLVMNTRDPLPIALAALEIVESLILTLVEKGVLPADDAARLLENVVDAKGSTAEEEGSASHEKAAAIARELQCSVEAVSKR